MIEIVARIVGLPQLFHDAPRAGIGRHREGDDLLELQDVECMAHHGLRALGGQSPAPLRCIEPPAYFDGGHERRLKARNREPDEADEFARRAQFGRPPTKTMADKMRFDGVGQAITLLFR